MIVVCNTSPIINLSAIGEIELLRKLFGKVYIPEAVYREIVIEGERQPGSKEVKELDWIETKKVENILFAESLKYELDDGEAEAIALAIETKSNLLIMDEKIGRYIAKHFKLNYIGLLGILKESKKKGLLKSLKPILMKLKNDAGFWMNDELVNIILKDVGEKNAK